MINHCAEAYDRCIVRIHFTSVKELPSMIVGVVRDIKNLIVTV